MRVMGGRVVVLVRAHTLLALDRGEGATWPRADQGVGKSSAAQRRHRRLPHNNASANVLLREDAAQAPSRVLLELATNAAKLGAL